MVRSISYKRRLRCEQGVRYRNTAKGVRSRVVAIWKSRGVVGDRHKFYDEIYLPATHCEVCENEFKSTYDKQCDHDHKTGAIRQVICKRCNVHDKWMKILIP